MLCNEPYGRTFQISKANFILLRFSFQVHFLLTYLQNEDFSIEFPRSAASAHLHILQWNVFEKQHYWMMHFIFPMVYLATTFQDFSSSSPNEFLTVNVSFPWAKWKL